MAKEKNNKEILRCCKSLGIIGLLFILSLYFENKIFTVLSVLFLIISFICLCYFFFAKEKNAENQKKSNKPTTSFAKEEDYKRRKKIDSLQKKDRFDFGLRPENPIVLYSEQYKTSYLNRLRTDDGGKLSWKLKEVMTFESDREDETYCIEKIQLYLFGMEYMKLYICPQGTRTSGIPEGFALTEYFNREGSVDSAANKKSISAEEFLKEQRIAAIEKWEFVSSEKRMRVLENMCRDKEFDEEIAYKVINGIDVNKSFCSFEHEVLCFTNLLQESIDNSNIKMVRFLLKNGFNPNFVDTDCFCESPFWYLQNPTTDEENKIRLEIAKLMLEYGASPNMVNGADSSLTDFILVKLLKKDASFEYLSRFFILLIAYGGRPKFVFPQIKKAFDKNNLEQYYLRTTEKSEGGSTKILIFNERDEIVACI